MGDLGKITPLHGKKFEPGGKKGCATNYSNYCSCKYLVPNNCDFFEVKCNQLTKIRSEKNDAKKLYLLNVVILQMNNPRIV